MLNAEQVEDMVTVTQVMHMMLSLGDTKDDATQFIGYALTEHIRNRLMTKHKFDVREAALAAVKADITTGIVMSQLTDDQYKNFTNLIDLLVDKIVENAKRMSYGDVAVGEELVIAMTPSIGKMMKQIETEL